MTLEMFDDLDGAIELANETQFGLSASIWTNRSDLGYRLARSIDAGGISVYASVEAARQAGPELGSCSILRAEEAVWLRRGGRRARVSHLYLGAVGLVLQLTGLAAPGTGGVQLTPPHSSNSFTTCR